MSQDGEHGAPGPDRVVRFWLIRHAPIAPPHDGKINGQIDVPCDLSDRPRLARLAKGLPDTAHWFATPLSRTRLTAEALAAGREPTIRADLSEQSFGEWEGLTWNDLNPAKYRAVARFWTNPGENRPPGGESFAEVIARVSRAVTGMVDSSESEDLVVVAHAGTVRAFLSLALGGAQGRDGVAAGMMFAIDPLSLTRLDAYLEDGIIRHWSIGMVNRTFENPGEDMT